MNYAQSIFMELSKSFKSNYAIRAIPDFSIVIRLISNVKSNYIVT